MPFKAQPVSSEASTKSRNRSSRTSATPATARGRGSSKSSANGEHSPKDRAQSLRLRPPENPLAKYSIVNALDELQENLIQKRTVFGELVHSGQATVFYAMPNTGKTLITLRLIIDGIKAGRFDPQKLNYLNLDDDATGLLEKSRMAELYGFHMMAPGFNGFGVESFFQSMRDMASSNTAKGIIVVADTLTKIVDATDKKAARELAEIVGEFKLKGGTFLALGHTNKRLDRNGKAVYAGASDIVDSFDSVWTIQEVHERLERDKKVVLFESQKSRGSSISKIAYGYTVAPDATYQEKLDSVRVVGSDDFASLRQVVHLTEDAPLIAAIEEAIRQGKTNKGQLVTAASVAANVDYRQANRVLERHTGTDPKVHRWTFKRVLHGAYEFRLLSNTELGENPRQQAKTA